MDGLVVELSGQWDGRIELRLYGGESIGRNALQPELRSAVGQLHRPRRSLAAYIRGGSFALGAALALGGLVLALVFSDDLFDAGFIAFMAVIMFAVLGGPLIAGALDSASRSYTSRVLPTIEFLPDSGVSQWERGSSRRRSFTGIVIALLALVVAAAQLIFDLA